MPIYNDLYRSYDRAGAMRAAQQQQLYAQALGVQADGLLGTTVATAPYYLPNDPPKRKAENIKEELQYEVNKWLNDVTL